MRKQAWFAVWVALVVVGVVLSAPASAQEKKGAAGFNGLGMNMGNLSLLSNAQTRSISPENFTGEKGKGGMATEGTNAGAADGIPGSFWSLCKRLTASTIFTIRHSPGDGAFSGHTASSTARNSSAVA